jgi:selenocysteine lyase/cysteine desulfurase
MLAQLLRTKIRELQEQESHPTMAAADENQNCNTERRRVRLTCSGTKRCGIVGFLVEGLPALEIKQLLLNEGICVTVSPASSTLIDATERNLPEVVRASVHYYNTEEEIERFVCALRKLSNAAIC